MSALGTQWMQLTDKFAALTKRERAIVSVAIVLGGGVLIFNFGVDPFLAKGRSAIQAESVARAELAEQKAQLSLLTAQNADPDASNRSRLAQAKKELLAVSERLARFEAGMVPPARMQAFLQELLAKNAGIELLGLKTLPVTTVGAPPADGANAPTQHTTPAAKENPAQAETTPAATDGIYQHGIEIKLAGSYNGLLNYLAELERMPQRVMWNSVSLTVEKHPRSVLVLRIYTLSLDPKWLVV
jgi:MSHA biogenesis protein MshJ